MIVVDSSGWIEFFTDGQLADDYAARLRNLALVVTPVIVLYEVYKRLKRELTEDDAVVAVWITSDRDFKDLPGVVFLPKKSYS